MFYNVSMRHFHTKKRKFKPHERIQAEKSGLSVESYGTLVMQFHISNYSESVKLLDVAYVPYSFYKRSSP